MSKVKKSKKKIIKPEKIPELVRREKEISTFGKLISLKPSQIHSSKSKYTRKQKHKQNEDEN